MFAINHAATALLVKRRFPAQPMLWLLLSVQAMELVWVLLNLLGVERTTTETTVESVADIHLAYGVFCWWIYRGGKALLAVIVLFNIANLSLLSPTVPGLESMLANRPTTIVLVILMQIVVTLALVGWLSARPGTGGAVTTARYSGA